METIDFNIYDGIALLSGVTRAAAPLVRLVSGRTDRPAADWAAYYRALAEAGYAGDPIGYMRRLILADRNPVSVDPSPRYRAELQRELDLLYGLAQTVPADVPALAGREAQLPAVTIKRTPPFSAAAFLRDWKRYGCGVFREAAAFMWDGKTKALKPVRNVHPIRLADLKEYEEERAKVLDNTLCFLDGLPANNVLLYGDRGTGKSSTVHAVLNELSPRGLKLIELNKSAICDLPLITDLLPKTMRFIVFIDDLSFESRSDDYAELKAALEGSVSRPDNILIYATTNRRHILKETHSDRAGDDLHAGDTMEEQLSLSDRFGLTITFMAPTKREFLSILRGILSDRGLTFPDETLDVLGERWALARGGRSPRAARQLADVVESRVKRGLPLDQTI